MCKLASPFRSCQSRQDFEHSTEELLSCELTHFHVAVDPLYVASFTSPPKQVDTEPPQAGFCFSIQAV